MGENKSRRRSLFNTPLEDKDDKIYRTEFRYTAEYLEKANKELLAWKQALADAEIREKELQKRLQENITIQADFNVLDEKQKQFLQNAVDVNKFLTNMKEKMIKDCQIWQELYNVQEFKYNYNVKQCTDLIKKLS